MSNNFKAGIRFNPNIYAEIGYDTQNESGEMSVIGANGETIWESGSGGGGSSGFTTVKMKLEGVTGVVNYTFPVLVENAGVTYLASVSQELGTNNEANITIPINGGAIGTIQNPTIYDMEVSGSIQHMFENQFIITGNCTITLAEQPT